MKKTICGMTIIISVVLTANAVTTEQIKTACLAKSDTLWVENNKVCIPKNSCKDSKFEQYCNRVFKDMYPNTYDGEEKDFVNLFAATRGIDCEAKDVEFDYDSAKENVVVCEGQDVSVFEFSTIIKKQDRMVNELGENTLFAVASSVCTKILDGERLSRDESPYECKGANIDFCKKAGMVNYSFPISIKQRLTITQIGGGCYISLR